MPFWCNWLHSESPSSGRMLCLLTKFLDYNLCIFFLINLPFIFEIQDIHRKFSCLEEDSSEKKIRNVVTSNCHNLHVIFKKISVNVFQEIFLVSSKAASYIFCRREDRFCWIAVILPAFFFFDAGYVGLPLSVLLKAPMNDWLPLMTVFQQTMVYNIGLCLRILYLCSMQGAIQLGAITSISKLLQRSLELRSLLLPGD